MRNVAEDSAGNRINLGREHHVRSAIQRSASAWRWRATITVVQRWQAQCREVTVTHSIGGNVGREESPRLHRIALIGEVKKEFVLHNRPANGSAILIPTRHAFLAL